MDVDMHQIQMTAEEDAESDSIKILWFFVGLVLSILGVLVAYIYQQAPRASRFFDKSQEWTVFYTDAYKAKVRDIQVKYSVIGFSISGILLVIYIIFMVSLYFDMWDRIMFDRYEFRDR